MNDVEYLQKDDTVRLRAGSYKGISEEKVTTSIRSAMVKHGLVMYPFHEDTTLHVVHSERTYNGETSKTVSYMEEASIKYRIVNIDDPNDFIEVVSRGHGLDTQDKAPGKAMTYAYKYALLRTFMLPTGDDPDKISSEKREDKVGKTKTVNKMPSMKEIIAKLEAIKTRKELVKFWDELPEIIRNDSEVSESFEYKGREIKGIK